MCRNCQVMLVCHPWSLVEDHPRKHIEEQVWSTVRTSEFGGIVGLYNDCLGPHVLWGCVASLAEYLDSEVFMLKP